MEQELVSVVIPTYKRPEELKRAINSVINQTYKNIEIIVIDDNYKYPEIRKKTESIVSKYKNIIYIENKENLGGSESRNVGINNAHGKYIAFLDDDDEFLPNKIEMQLKLYKKLEKQEKKVGLIYCYANVIKDGKIYKTIQKDYEGIPLAEHMIECIAATSWWICKKEVLIDIGYFDELSSHQDAALILKLLSKGYEIYRVPEILLNYYVYNNKDRISKVDNKYINTDLYYRDLCRKQYEKIKNKKQIKNVEYSFNKRLCYFYIKNKEFDKAKKELKAMCKIFPFKLQNLKYIVKFLIKK